MLGTLFLIVRVLNSAENVSLYACILHIDMFS